MPVDDFFKEVRPLVVGHRFLPYLENLALPPRRAAQALSELAERLDLAEVEPTERHMIDDLRDQKLPAGEMMPAKNRVNGDFLVGRYLLNRHQPEAARKYLKRCADLGELHIWLRLLATDALRELDSASK